MDKKQKEIEKRWKVISKLVKTYGTYKEKLAWDLCLNDTILWRVTADSEKNIRKKTKKIELAICGVFFIAVIVGSYFLSH